MTQSCLIPSQWTWHNRILLRVWPSLDSCVHWAETWRHRNSIYCHKSAWGCTGWLWYNWSLSFYENLGLGCIKASQQRRAMSDFVLTQWVHGLTMNLKSLLWWEICVGFHSGFSVKMSSVRYVQRPEGLNLSEQKCNCRFGIGLSKMQKAVLQIKLMDLVWWGNFLYLKQVISAKLVTSKILQKAVYMHQIIDIDYIVDNLVKQPTFRGTQIFEILF